MLKSVRTKALYGRFNYFFDFSKDKMTIITGPNGFGKTTILNLIRDILDDDIYELTTIPFEELELCTDDDKKLLFQRKDGDLLLNGEKIYVPTSIDDNNPRSILFTISSKDSMELRKKTNRIVLPQQILNVGSIYLNGDSADLSGVSTDDLVVRINSQLLGKPTFKIANDLMSFYQSVGNSIFCGADRLYRNYAINDGGKRKKQLNEVINSLSNTLEEVFSNYNQTYTRLSTELDLKFLPSLVKESNCAKDNDIYTSKDYEKDMKLIKHKLNRLLKYGFLLKENYYTSNIPFDDKYCLAYKIFADNYKQKLECLDGLSNRLDLYTSIVNSKLTNKKMTIIQTKSPNKYSAIQILDNDNNNVIPLASLSSGEKEIIVMYFKLIFEMNRGVIALIDEPEISSHVSWQYDMLDDFEKILKVNNLVKQMIICTHSPQVVNNHWDKTIDLFDLEQKHE